VIDRTSGFLKGRRRRRYRAHRLPMSRLAVLLTVLAALALPATASAASIFVPSCSRSLPGQRTVAVSGAGFTPGGTVNLVADGQAIGTGIPVDASGSFRTATLAPELSSPRRNLQTFRLTATDTSGVAAAAPLQITRVTAVLPQRARPRSRVRISVFGFAPGEPVYLHVRRGDRTRGTFRIGTGSTPCGRASRRLRYMPLRRYSPGRYDYVFQLSRRYRPADPAVRLGVSILRRSEFA
jgi:hypothetical protein